MGQDQSGDSYKDTTRPPKVIPTRTLKVFGSKKLINAALEELKQSINSYETCTVWRTASRMSLDADFAYCSLFKVHMTGKQLELFCSLETKIEKATNGRTMCTISFNGSDEDDSHDLHTFIIKTYEKDAMETIILHGEYVPIDIEDKDASIEESTQIDEHVEEDGNTKSKPQDWSQMKLVFSGKMFSKSGKGAAAYIFRRLKEFHRKRLMGLFTKMTREAKINLPVSLEEFKQILSKCHNRVTEPEEFAFGCSELQKLISTHLKWMPWYFEYVYDPIWEFDVARLFQYWPFENNISSIGDTILSDNYKIFAHCWQLYGDRLYNKCHDIVEALIESNRKNPEWKCCDDPYFNLIWKIWKCVDLYNINLAYLPIDLVKIFVDNYREKYEAEARRMAGVDEERRIEREAGRTFGFGPRTDEKIAEQAKKDAEGLQKYIGYLLTRVVENQKLYQPEELKRVGKRLVDFAAIDDDTNWNQAVLKWIERYVCSAKPLVLTYWTNNFLST